MTDPWGMEQPSAQIGTPGALPDRLSRLAEVEATGLTLTDEDLLDFPVAEELPEVQALMRQGWRPLHDAPLYCLLPAAWPSEYRTWIPDRLPRVGLGVTADNYQGEVLALPRDDDFPAEQAHIAGLPDPPRDRIWLLRSPWPRIPVSVIYEIIWAVVERSPTRDETANVYRVATDVLTWDEQEALEACPGDTRELLDAWAAVGRVGEEAAQPIDLGVRPAVLREALARTELDERTLLAWLASLESDLDEDAITFIRDWRARGLPGNPPRGAERYADRDLDEVKAWLEAGFDLYAAGQLEHVGLNTAICWREAGFTEADTVALLRADPALLPEQAHAFDNAGLDHERRSEWIYYGFSAAEATDWTAAGLTPYQARLWRACNKGPHDVEPGQQFPPQLLEGRRHLGFSRTAGGEWTNSEWDELPDPPGTGGAWARHSAD